MFKTIKQRLQNQRGLTLIELLAVVVILGIIAAIAIPAIGGLIDNSKKDAHVANAQTMINSAKTWVTSHNTDEDFTNGKAELNLTAMETDGLIDDFKDPDKIGYVKADSKVIITKTGKKFTYEVILTNGKRGVIGDKDTAVKEGDIKRSIVGDLK